MRCCVGCAVYPTTLKHCTCLALGPRYRVPSDNITTALVYPAHISDNYQHRRRILLFSSSMSRWTTTVQHSYTHQSSNFWTTRCSNKLPDNLGRSYSDPRAQLYVESLWLPTAQLKHVELLFVLHMRCRPRPIDRVQVRIRYRDPPSAHSEPNYSCPSPSPLSILHHQPNFHNVQNAHLNHSSPQRYCFRPTQAREC